MDNTAPRASTAAYRACRHSSSFCARSAALHSPTPAAPASAVSFAESQSTPGRSASFVTDSSATFVRLMRARSSSKGVGGASAAVAVATAAARGGDAGACMDGAAGMDAVEAAEKLADC